MEQIAELFFVDLAIEIQILNIQSLIGKVLYIYYIFSSGMAYSTVSFTEKEELFDVEEKTYAAVYGEEGTQT